MLKQADSDAAQLRNESSRMVVTDENTADEGATTASKSGAVGSTISTKKKHSLPFPLTLFNILADAEANGDDNIVSFMPDGRTFAIHNQDEFIRKIMPRYFNTKRIESFQRQLLLYGFKRVVPYGDFRAGYFHEFLFKGQKQMALCITRQRQGSSRRKTCNASSAVVLKKEATRDPLLSAAARKEEISNETSSSSSHQQQQPHCLASLLSSDNERNSLMASSQQQSSSSPAMVNPARIGMNESLPIIADQLVCSLFNSNWQQQQQSLLSQQQKQRHSSISSSDAIVQSLLLMNQRPVAPPPSARSLFGASELLRPNHLLFAADVVTSQQQQLSSTRTLLETALQHHHHRSSAAAAATYPAISLVSAAARSADPQQRALANAALVHSVRAVEQQQQSRAALVSSPLERLELKQKLELLLLLHGRQR